MNVDFLPNLTIRITQENLNRFLVNMNCAFQDKEHLYLVLDLMPGGDLRYQLSQRKTFSEKETSYIYKIIIL